MIMPFAQSFRLQLLQQELTQEIDGFFELDWRKAKTDQQRPRDVISLPKEGDTSRTCRICQDDEAEDPKRTLIAPCRCSGSGKWVHRDCIDEWRARSMNRENFVRCSTCKQAFVLENMSHLGEEVRSLHKAKVAKHLTLFFSTILFFLLLTVCITGLVNYFSFPLEKFLPTWWTTGFGRFLFGLLMGIAMFFAICGVLFIMLWCTRLFVGDCCAPSLTRFYCCFICFSPQHPPAPSRSLHNSDSSSSCCNGCFCEPGGGCSSGGGGCGGCGGCGGSADGEALLIFLLIIFILLVLIGIIAVVVFSVIVVSEVLRRHVVVLEHRSLAHLYPLRDLSAVALPVWSVNS